MMPLRLLLAALLLRRPPHGQRYRPSPPTPEEIHAKARRLYAEAEHLMSLLPTDYFASDMDRRHGSPLRGEQIEASEIEGVS